MTTDISSDGLMAIYAALSWTPGDHVAVKLSTGEPGSNYLRTDLIGPLVQSLDDPTIVECNTAYGGSRSNTAMHYQVAKDHGYTVIADVDIMDEDGSMTLPVVGGTNLTENYVGRRPGRFPGIYGGSRKIGGGGPGRENCLYQCHEPTERRLRLRWEPRRAGYARHWHPGLV